MKLILDTSVLIAFYTELRKEHFLLSLQEHGYDMLVPEYVFRSEMKSDYEKLDEAVKRNEITILSRIRDEDIEVLKGRFPSLNRGELEVIWWGMKLRSENELYACVLDDGKARKCAQRSEVEIIGSLGIIEILNDLEIISKEEKRRICETLRKKGFRMPDDYEC